MKKVLLCSLMLCAGILLGYDLKNPALNKVRFLKTPSHKPLALVVDGKLQFAVVVDTKSEHHLRARELRIIPNAAKTLADNMEKCYGTRPQILEYHAGEALKKYPFKIYVGQSPMTKKYGIKPESAGWEGFIVTTVPDGVAIVGNDSSLDPDYRKDPNDRRMPRKATLWGVYDFLERFCNCRFYYPGDFGSLHPKSDKLIIRPVAYTDKPHFMRRSEMHILWSLQKNNRKMWESMLGKIDGSTFAESWRLGRSSQFWGGHNPYPERMLKSYPDKKETLFFRSQSGTLYHNPARHIGNYFDFTNLKLADLFVESLKKYYASNGKENDGWVGLSSKYIALGQCDTEVPLPDMISHPTVIKERLIQKAHLDRGVSYYSDIYGRFYQYFGNRLKKELPGKKVVLLPYSMYTHAPTDKRWVLPDNIELCVCSFSLPSFTRNSKKMADQKKMMNDWYKALGNRPIASLWLYNVPKNTFARAVVPQFVCDIPKIFGKTLGNMELFLDQYGGLQYYFYCANYAASRGMWNPSFDYEAAYEEHWIPFYGREAGPEVRAFHKLLNECYIKYHTPQDEWSPLYPLASIDKLEKHMKKALSLVKPGTVEAKRVAFYFTPWKEAIASQRNRHSYNRPVYGARQLLPAEKVILDGLMNEPFWKDISPVPMMDPAGTGIPRKNAPVIRLAWNKNGIYGILRGNWAPKVDHKSIWNNCNIEMFFSPGVKKEQYFHYTVDARNAGRVGQRELLPVAKPYNSSWKSPGFKHVVQRTAKDWTLEFFIPFRDMKVKLPKAYDCWIMNLISNKAAGEKEYSASAFTMNNNHDIDLHGFVKFLGKGD